MNVWDHVHAIVHDAKIKTLILEELQLNFNVRSLFNIY